MKLSQLALFALSAHGDEAQSYTVPSKPENFVFFETFDSPNALDGWTMSKDKKYDGKRLLEIQNVITAEFRWKMGYRRAVKWWT